MACNSCSKTFSLFRREKGCPSCGFSYCTNCLDCKIFIPKLNSEAKVCRKCERTSKTKEKANIEPPDAYYKRIGTEDSGSSTSSKETVSGSSKDQEILDRLQKLKEDSSSTKITNEDIVSRLEKIKGELPSTSEAELQLRLANIRGVPVSTLQSKPIKLLPDNRTEQEQVEDLMKQYMEQTKIDGKYQDEFQDVIENIQTRLLKLKNTDQNTCVLGQSESIESMNKDDLHEIIKDALAESRLENESADPVLDELPFCEICNEDAKMRCLGCKYLFCKHCFIEHKDEDDGCDKYDLYKP